MDALGAVIKKKYFENDLDWHQQKKWQQIKYFIRKNTHKDIWFNFQIYYIRMDLNKNFHCVKIICI